MSNAGTTSTNAVNGGDDNDETSTFLINASLSSSSSWRLTKHINSSSLLRRRGNSSTTGGSRRDYYITVGEFCRMIVEDMDPSHFLLGICRKKQNDNSSSSSFFDDVVVIRYGDGIETEAIFNPACIKRSIVFVSLCLPSLAGNNNNTTTLHPSDNVRDHLAKAAARSGQSPIPILLNTTTDNSSGSSLYTVESLTKKRLIQIWRTEDGSWDRMSILRDQDFSMPAAAATTTTSRDRFNKNGGRGKQQQQQRRSGGRGYNSSGRDSYHNNNKQGGNNNRNGGKWDRNKSNNKNYPGQQQPHVVENYVQSYNADMPYSTTYSQQQQSHGMAGGPPPPPPLHQSYVASYDNTTTTTTTMTTTARRGNNNKNRRGGGRGNGSNNSHRGKNHHHHRQQQQQRIEKQTNDGGSGELDDESQSLQAAILAKKKEIMESLQKGKAVVTTTTDDKAATMDAGSSRTTSSQSKEPNTMTLSSDAKENESSALKRKQDDETKNDIAASKTNDGALLPDADDTATKKTRSGPQPLRLKDYPVRIGKRSLPPVPVPASLPPSKKVAKTSEPPPLVTNDNGDKTSSGDKGENSLRKTMITIKDLGKERNDDNPSTNDETRVEHKDNHQSSSSTSNSIPKNIVTHNKTTTPRTISHSHSLRDDPLLTSYLTKLANATKVASSSSLADDNDSIFDSTNDAPPTANSDTNPPSIKTTQTPLVSFNLNPSLPSPPVIIIPKGILTRRHEAIYKGHSSWVCDILFTKGSNHFLSGAGDATVKLWDKRSLDCVRTYEGHKKAIFSIDTVATDDRLFVTGSRDSTAKLWDFETGKCLRTFYDAEHHATVAGGMAPTVEANRLNDLTHAVYSVANIDGDCFASSCGNKVHVWDIETGRCVATIPVHEYIGSKVKRIDENTFITGSWDQTIKLWDIRIRSTATSENDSNNNGGDNNNNNTTPRSSTISSVSASPVRTFSGHLKSIESLHVIPDTHTFYSGSDDNTVKIWDIRTGSTLRTYTGHNQAVTAIDRIDDDRFVTGCADGTAKLWDAKSGDCQCTYLANYGEVNAVVDIDGVTFLTGQEDSGYVKLWTYEVLPEDIITEDDLALRKRT